MQFVTSLLFQVLRHSRKVKMAHDPVCGMSVTRENAAAAIEHDGINYLFCSTHCADKFKSDPERFVPDADPGAARAASHSCCSHKHSAHTPQRQDGPKDAVYTCPMHPEVRQIGPRLGIRYGTVRMHRERALDRLGLNGANRAEVTSRVFALAWELLMDEPCPHCGCRRDHRQQKCRLSPE